MEILMVRVKKAIDDMLGWQIRHFQRRAIAWNGSLVRGWNLQYAAAMLLQVRSNARKVSEDRRSLPFRRRRSY